MVFLMATIFGDVQYNYPKYGTFNNPCIETYGFNLPSSHDLRLQKPPNPPAAILHPARRVAAALPPALRVSAQGGEQGQRGAKVLGGLQLHCGNAKVLRFQGGKMNELYKLR